MHTFHVTRSIGHQGHNGTLQLCFCGVDALECDCSQKLTGVLFCPITMDQIDQPFGNTNPQGWGSIICSPAIHAHGAHAAFNQICQLGPLKFILCLQVGATDSAAARRPEARRQHLQGLADVHVLNPAEREVGGKHHAADCSVLDVIVRLPEGLHEGLGFPGNESHLPQCLALLGMGAEAGCHWATSLATALANANSGSSRRRHHGEVLGGALRQPRHCGELQKVKEGIFLERGNPNLDRDRLEFKKTLSVVYFGKKTLFCLL